MIFNDTSSSSNGILEIIKTLGNNIVGCEVGVWRGYNLCQILENCENINKMYAIDEYKAYMDWDGEVTEEMIEYSKSLANYHLSLLPEESKKVNFLEMKSDKAVTHINDNELDFIFIDGDHSYEFAYKDFCNFYSKVRSNGLFAGHDYSLQGVNKALLQFLKENNYSINDLKLVSNDAWYIIKK